MDRTGADLWAFPDRALQCSSISLDSRSRGRRSLLRPSGRDPRFRGATAKAWTASALRPALDQGRLRWWCGKASGRGSIAVPDPFEALDPRREARKLPRAGLRPRGSSGSAGQALLTAALQAHYGAGAVHATEGLKQSSRRAPVPARLPQGTAAAVTARQITPGDRAPKPAGAADGGPHSEYSARALGGPGKRRPSPRKTPIAAGLGPEGVLVCPDRTGAFAGRPEDHRGQGTAATFTAISAAFFRASGLAKPLGAEHRQRSACPGCLQAAGLPSPLLCPR